MQSEFEHCIRSDQEVPFVREAEKDEILPQNARWMGEENRVTRGWYILMCDPSLPEAEYWEDVPRLFAAGGSGLSRSDLKDFDKMIEEEGDMPFEFEDLDD